jgi:AcrR family transcriptional regulator
MIPMASQPLKNPGRVPLTRQRVLAGAFAVADSHGIEALTMRSLAEELGVKPMSVYHHVANKEAILDGLVDSVFAEIELPNPNFSHETEDWVDAMRQRAHSARLVLKRHPWAITLMNSRLTPGSSTLRHHDAVIGTLRRAGFSVAMAAHSFSLIDSFIYGFALQESTLPFDGPDDVTAMAERFLQHFPVTEFPHLAEMTTQHVMQPGYDYGDEFAFGLEVVLDALQSLRTR